jgi:cell division protein FtsQ
MEPHRMANAQAATHAKPKSKAAGASSKAKVIATTSSRQAGKKAAEERGRKKQMLKWRRYASVVGSILLIAIVWMGYANRIDQRFTNWMHNTWLATSTALGFQFRELIVEGRNLTPSDAIVNAVGLSVGDSLFLMQLDTVKDAHVMRDLSGRIIITLIERTPFALWQHHDRLRVVDDSGTVLQRENPDNYPYLVTMVGDKAPEHIDNLVSFLAADKELAEQVVAAVFVSDRRWDIHFASGIQILLPELNPKAAWKKLAEMNREHEILKQQVQAIDLRVNDRVFITLPDEAAPDDVSASDA